MATSPIDLDTDASLVVAAQGGDPEAFAELFRRHHQSVRRACARRLRDVAEADEVAQAAFVRAYERIDRCGGDRRFGGWVHVIAHNLCIDALRARARTAPEAAPVADDVHAPGEPEEELLRGEQSNLVHLALADLPARQREVVVARHLHDRRPHEIAVALGLTVGAVDSLLLRGRRRLALSVERLAGDHGVTTVSSAATTVATTGVAATSSRLAGAVDAVSELIGRAAFHAASTFGVVPGVPSVLERAAAGGLVAAALALGSPAGVPADQPPPAGMTAVSAPGVTTVVPATTAPVTPPSADPSAAPGPPADAGALAVLPDATAAPPASPARAETSAPDLGVDLAPVDDVLGLLQNLLSGR